MSGRAPTAELPSLGGTHLSGDAHAGPGQPEPGLAALTDRALARFRPAEKPDDGRGRRVAGRAQIGFGHVGATDRPRPRPRRRLRSPVRPADRPPRARGAGSTPRSCRTRCRSRRCSPGSPPRSSSPAARRRSTRGAPGSRRRAVRRPAYPSSACATASRRWPRRSAARSPAPASREYGRTPVQVDRAGTLLADIPAEHRVWMSHGDSVHRRAPRASTSSPPPRPPRSPRSRTSTAGSPGCSGTPR